MDKKNSIRTHRFKFAFVFLALMMGLGTALNAAPPQVYSFWVEQSNGNNGQNFTTLSAAVASINTRAYPCNLYINEDCTLHEAITFTNTNNYAVTIYGNNHTITRGSGVTGDLITYNRTTTRALIIYDLTLDGANVSATGSLLKFGASVQLTLSNFTAINHTASANGVCAVDASVAGTANYVQLNTAKIIGNTANGKPANLKIPGDATYTRFNTSLTDDIGITTTNSGLNTDFARWLDASNTGWEHLKNDVLEDNGTPYQTFYSATGRVRWISAENNFYVEGTDGANGESFSTLSAAVASINDRNYACNLHIFEDCTLNEAITITSTRNRAVTIFGNGHTVTRGSGATGNMITYERNSELKINNLTFDGANASATGALLYCTGSGALTVSNSEFKGSTVSSTGGLISKSVTNNCNITFTNTIFTGNAATGDLLSFSQSSGNRTVSVSFNNCTINGASNGNGNLVSHTTNSGTFVANNTTFTRNQSTGYGCYITSSGDETFTDCTFDGSNTTAATQPLLKSGTGALTLTNTTVKNHTVSAANVCAVDATAGTANVNVSGTTNITGNTSNEVAANLSVNGTNRLTLTNNLTGTIGVTTPKVANEQFAVLSSASVTGFEKLQNDTNPSLLSALQTSTAIEWYDENSKYQLVNGTTYTYYLTLKEAVNAAPNNGIINSLVNEDTIDEAIVAGNAITIQPGTGIDQLTLKRGTGVTGDLITANAALTLNKVTLDGNNVDASGSLLKMGGNYILTLTDVIVTGHTVSATDVCAVDASAATHSYYVQIYSAHIIGNTANGNPANLKITGNTAMYIYRSLTQDIGITNLDNDYYGDQFGYLNTLAHTGMEHLKNDLHNRFEGTSSGHEIKWTAISGIDPLDVMFGFPNVSITDLVTEPSASDLSVVPFSAIPGTNNANPTNPYAVWKSATYNADNSVDITLNYFQKQVGLKLDFIFVIDETGTMGDNKTANGYTMKQAMWARKAALEASKGVLQLNTTYAENGAANRIRYISFGESTVIDGGFMNNYEEAAAYIDSYDVIGGSTNHSVGINAATAACNQSRANGHTPIVVYLSDYQAHFDQGTESTGALITHFKPSEMNALKTAAESIYALLVFQALDATIEGRMNLMTPLHYYMPDQDDPSTLITPFVDIVHDAVAHCGNGTVVEDELGNGLVAAAAANGVTSSDGTGSYGATNAVIDDNGTETWQLLNDAADDNRLYTGHMYSKVINVPMTDDVYSGAMPTNAGLTVKDDNVEVNRIDGSPILSKPLTLVLKSANTSGAPIADATFKLEHDGNTWNLTTDANGQIVLPWGASDVVGATTAESKFAFATGQHYTLTQNTTLNGFVMPTGSWTLTVGPDYKITASGATPAIEAHTGKFEIYNETVKIARVSNDGGSTWTYHEYLINSSGTGTAQGAFDYANTLSGNVIIETLLETAVIGSVDRYTLTEGFTFNGADLTGLTLKTTNDAGYNSTGFITTISRGDNFGSLITLNNASTTMTIENLTLDGNNGTYTCNANGGLVNVTNGTLSLADGATLQNSTVDDSYNGGGVYIAADGNLTVSGVVIVDNNKKGTTDLNNVYLDASTCVAISAAGLDCGSHIGITKTSGYTEDVNNVQHTIIAQGTMTNCPSIFLNGYFFDDQNVHKVYCLSYGSEYTTNNLYFIETWDGQAANTSNDIEISSNTITVKTAAGLAYIAQQVNNGDNFSGKTVKLSHDINLNGRYWVPIGIKGYTDGCSNTVANKPFAGTFNGQDYVISNMMSILPYQDLGLFGLTQNATITNTFIESGTLASTYSPTGDEKCSIGGLVGELYGGTVSYCEAVVSMTENAGNVTCYMGGLAGKADKYSTTNFIIHSSMAMPEISAGNNTIHNRMGGLLGYLGASGTVANCFANPKFTFGSGWDQFAGGISGESNEGYTLNNCYVRLQSTQPSSSQAQFGWLIGSGDSGTIKYCYIPDGETVYIGNVVTDLTTCGTYTTTTLLNNKYSYGQDDQKVGETPLVDKLNAQATGDYAHWTRTMASPINGDYPVLMMPGTNSLGSKDGLFIFYDDNVNELWTEHGFNSATSGTMYLYDVQPTLGSATEPAPVSITGNTSVPLYINENVGITQEAGKALTARVGITFDNSSNNDLGGKDYDWHMFSSALSNAPLGVTYNDEATNYYGYEIPSSNIELQSTGYFPANTPFENFDFYCFYEPQYHWINFKRHSNDHWHQDEPHNQISYTNESELNPGKGYMIAIDKTTMLMADGELNNGDTPAKNLSNTSGAAFPGINLIGNPYQSYLDFDEFASVNSGSLDGDATSTYAMVDADQTGYVYYTAGSTPSLAPRYVHPHQGFFVGVKNGVTSLSFTNAMRVAGKGNSTFREEHLNYPLVNLFCFDANGKRDYTTVEINRPDAGGGRKFNAPKISNVWISAHFDNCDYQTLFAPEGVNEVPVRFEAFEDGVYTMKWSMFNGDFNYVHLIDNRTGADIDLLATDEYKFEGKTSDYISRFRLVFEVTDIEEPETDETTTGATTFAFQNGDELVVTGNGILQFFDLNGRCLMSTQLAGEQSSVSLPAVAKGMYLLRLTGSKQTQVQKIIIK